jgi:uncharacterized protein YneF (UPF0154 family)
MLYLISIVLSLLAGFACGVLFFRNNAAKIKSTEDKGKALLAALKGK